MRAFWLIPFTIALLASREAEAVPIRKIIDAIGEFFSSSQKATPDLPPAALAGGDRSVDGLTIGRGVNGVRRALDKDAEENQQSSTTCSDDAGQENAEPRYLLPSDMRTGTGCFELPHLELPQGSSGGPMPVFSDYFPPEDLHKLGNNQPQ
jgi:hypothetical protein